MEDKCIIDPQRDCIGKAEAAKLEGLTYQEANDIERILLAVDALITNMINAYFYSNEINCGEV